ncbi:MAG: CotH kinase family protein [Deltaproteobacteria bacterium]
MKRFALLIVAGLVACGTDEGEPLDSPRDGGPVATRDAGQLPPPRPDPAPYYTPDRLLEVDIRLAPEDWDALRMQTREIVSLLAGDCQAEPFESPYTYFTGTVTVDGETVENVGVRKKGFIGSLSELRPSLKVKMDEYVIGQHLGGLIRMTFNNARQDPAIIRQCIAYATFLRVGVPAPRCNFAHVTVNGEDLGVYAHVEPVKKPYLREHFSDDEGLLYEGTLSDFREGWTGTFEKKTNRMDPDDRARIAAMVEALEVPDDQLLAALAEVIDLDAYLVFWATEVLIAHWDGYAGNTNNFYIYVEPGQERFTFMPWGVDGVLGQGGDPNLPAAVYANGLLARRLYDHPEGRQRYLDALRFVLAEAWPEDELLTGVTTTADIIRPFVYAPQPFEDGVQAVRRFVEGRRAALDAEINQGGLAWPLPLRDSFCFEEIGRVEATLTTTWGSHPAQNVFMTGTGVASGEVNGNPIMPDDVGASAGFGQGPDDAGEAVFLGGLLFGGQALAVTYVVVDPDLVQPGATVPLDGVAARGALLYTPQIGQQLNLVGFFSGGTVTFDRGSTDADAPIELRLSTGIFAGL